MISMTLDQNITSKNFPLVQQAKRLSRKKRVRDEEGQFIVEGVREFLLAVENGVKFQAIFLNKDVPSEGDLARTLARVRESREDVAIHRVSDSVYSSMGYRTSSGMLGIAYMHDIQLDEFGVPDRPFVVVCAGIEKPGNLGAILRSADGVGVDAVIVADPILDIFNPNVVRASLGTLFSTPIILTNLDSLVPWLQRHEIGLIATSPTAKTNYTSLSYPEGVAIVVGNEAQGLDLEWFEQARETVFIPQVGQADSLNTAMSATIVLYEVFRQRCKRRENSLSDYSYHNV